MTNDLLHLVIPLSAVNLSNKQTLVISLERQKPAAVLKQGWNFFLFMTWWWRAREWELKENGRTIFVPSQYTWLLLEHAYMYADLSTLETKAEFLTFSTQYCGRIWYRIRYKSRVTVSTLTFRPNFAWILKQNSA